MTGNRLLIAQVVGQHPTADAEGYCDSFDGGELHVINEEMV
jgi:hypothetical protein